MESGVLKSDGLESLLRTLSSKKSSGLLELEFPGLKVTILFLRGKITDILPEKTNTLEATKQFLKRAALFDKSTNTDAETLFAFMEQLQAQGIRITAEQMKLATYHRVMQGLLDLPTNQGAYYTFRMEVVNEEDLFAPSITPTQILLERESFKESMGIFNEQFPKGEKLVWKLEASAADEEIKDGEELFFLRALGKLSAQDRPCTIEQLKQYSMLSDVTFRRFLSDYKASGEIVLESEGALHSAQMQDLASQPQSAAHAASELAQSASIPPSDGLSEIESEEELDPITPSPAKHTDEKKSPSAAQTRKKVKAELHIAQSKRERIYDAAALVLLMATLAAPFFLWSGALVRFAR